VYRKQVRRRRAILVGLIVVSLVLHAIQRGVATILSPVGEVAERALKPVRDLLDWFDETFEARGENEELRAEVAELRAQVAAGRDAATENADLKRMLELDRSVALGGFEPVTARVVGRSPTVWFSTVTISEGTNAGVEVNDAVINADGLVGRIREATGAGAQVELITDPDNAVSAEALPTTDIDDAIETALLSENPTGIVAPVAGDPDDLLLDFIDDTEPIEENQTLITAGWSNGVVSSAYPPGIPIGEVSQIDVGEEGDFQRVHVAPFADLRNLEYVQVLTGGRARPGVPG
jgi:rod shape-determining protein MreC